jgi:site-specific DNA recombinase
MVAVRESAVNVALAPYLRVSTSGQITDTQRAVLERYCDTQAVAPVGWYGDAGVSGYGVRFADRPSGARLLADIRAGRVGIVLVTKLDRFGRNAREILNAVHDLEDAGARLVSLKENVDTSTSAGRFFLTVLAGVAELEREMIVERTDEGMAERLADTTWMGGHAPIGYRVEGKKRTARLVINDTIDEQSGYSEVDVVRLGWHLLVEQDWACDRIADRLSDLGIRTRNGKARWAPAVVYQMLADPIYAGVRTYTSKDGTVHTHAVPAILTSEQLARAQGVLRAHRRFSHASPDYDYLLRGLMRCALCGATYTTSWCKTYRGTGPIWRYYACSTRHYRVKYARRNAARGAPIDCCGASVDAREIEAEVWADVEQFIRDPAHVLTLLAAQSQGQADHEDGHRARLAGVQRELDNLQQQRDSVLALYRRGRISERDLDRQLDAIGQEETTHQLAHKRALAALEDATMAHDRLETARTLLQRLHARLDTEPMTPALKRELIEALVVSITVDTEEVGLSKRGRVKRRAVVRVTYCFEEPLAPGQAVPDADQSCDDFAPVPR